MSNLFSQVLNMSMTGSVVILLVMLARLILKRAQKIFSYALWSVVLFRLLCPVAFTASVSVLNALEPEVQEASESTSVVYYLPAEVRQASDFTFIPAENQSGTDNVQVGESGHIHLDLMVVASYVWITGSGIMILYSAIQYIRLRGKLVGAVVYRGNVYRVDYIDTPFVMGIFSPQIYLPSDVPMNERKYIIAHERHHIRRCDHIIKLLAYFALCIHWFNPLVWAAFILAGKDMEMSCDEAVIRKMGSQIRADYSASLLRLATHKKIIAGMPLAFGEGDTKGRVMNMAKWKKPKLWVSFISLVLCAAVLVACAVNPADEEYSDEQQTEQLPLVDSVELEPVVDGTMIITDTELVQYGTLKMLLPSGFAAREQDGAIVLMKDSIDVGGITCWSHPGFEPDDMIEWIKALGIPELQEDYEVPIGYMAEGSSYGDFEIEIFWDGNPDALNIEHQFFIDGNIVYDVWFDQNLISDGIAERFLKTVAINAEPNPAFTPEEQEALIKCKSVIDTVQRGSYHIGWDESRTTSTFTSGYCGEFFSHDEDWLHITYFNINDNQIETQYRMKVNGQICYNVESPVKDNISWSDGNITEPVRPWLSSYQWDDTAVAYVDTLHEQGIETIMLRIDEPFYGYPEETQSYYVNFVFDGNGSFLRVELEAIAFRNNELWTANETEKIYSLDSETVNAKIQKEYQKAIG